MKVDISKVKLVEPKQGWGSLHPNLRLAYSVAMHRGYTDLGTYANKAGDHGYSPARAFDIGRKDRFLFKGWNYIKAKRLAIWYWENRAALHIDYVILGNRIISTEKPYWHPFTRDKSHYYHIHVSMIWPGKYV